MKISKYDQSYESVGLKFWQVHMLWSRKIRNSLDQLGITHTQFVVLASILEIKESQIENEVTQKMISKFSNIDVMTISSVMRLLLKKEWVIIEENTRDSRAKSVGLTEKGMEILVEAVKLVEDADDDFFDISNNEKENFMKTLNKLSGINQD